MVELDWERDEVLVDLLGAVEKDGGLELIISNQWRSTVSLESAHLEVTVWHLEFNELVVYLVGWVLNDDYEFRFLAIWGVELVVLFSGEDTWVKLVDLNSLFLLELLLEHLEVEVLDLSKEFLGLDVEVLADLWDTGTGDGIVVLQDADVLEDSLLLVNDLLRELGVSRDGVLGLKSQR